VATNRWSLFLLAAAIALLGGCGGSNANVQNPPPPPQSDVSIAFQPQPGGSLAVGFTENLTAVVSNDSSNDGVDWSLTCQADPDNKHGLCGSLSALHTASGSPTTYAAPSTLSTSSMGVEIVAYATVAPTENAVAPITITSFDSLLNGSYVLQLQGTDANGGPNYQFAGVVVFDGNGGITSGEQTVNFADSTGALLSKSDPILAAPNSYFVGNDGRGTITITTADDTIGGNGIETFAFVILSSFQALISQMDISSKTVTVATGASASGTMNLQTSTAAPSGGYAFAVSGLNVVKTLPLAVGGILNVDSPGKISGNGSVTDEILGKKVVATGLGISGTITAPDQFGAVTLSLLAPFGTANKAIPVQFTGYIVDSTHIELIESDNIVGSTSAFGSTAGVAIGQGTATGAFNNSALLGSYVFSILGADLSPLPESSAVPATLTAAGVLTADGKGNLTDGFTDTFLALNTAQGTAANPQTGAQISAAFDGTYSADTSGTGRATLTLDNFNPNPKHGYQPVLFFYFTGSGSENTPLILEAGANAYPLLGAGIAYPQSTAAPAFGGDYGFSFTQELSGSSENDGTGQMTASPAATPPSLSGVADVNFSFTANLDQPFTGGFSAPASNGLFQGTLVDNSSIVSSVVFNPQIAADFYSIDAGHGFFVETDLVTQGAAQNGQVSLGYYAARAPVCAGCP